MIKNLLAIATVAALAACSSGSDTPAPDPGTPAVNPPVNPPTGGGNPPASDTKAGAYIGDFGSGNGVYVINNENAISGLALNADSSANSLFGNVGTGSTFAGELRGYSHSSNTPTGEGSFGAIVPAEGVTNTSFNLNIVNGQTIESLSGPAVSLAGSSGGSLAPASAATLSGSWSGSHRFCGSDVINCDVLVTDITFNGTSIVGQTSIVKPTGLVAPGSIFQIAGGITEFGDVSLISFTWQEGTYNGVAFFAPGRTGELVFVGEDPSQEVNKTIASLLTR